MRPGLANIIEKVCISWYFESPETDLHIAENACYIDYTDTWSSKRVHCLLKDESPTHGTFDYGWEYMFELSNGVTRVGLLITGIHRWVAPISKIWWLPATLCNTRWMDNFEVCHRNIKGILILDPVDVEVAYSDIGSRYYIVQWHVWLHGWHNASFG